MLFNIHAESSLTSGNAGDGCVVFKGLVRGLSELLTLLESFLFDCFVNNLGE